MSVSATYSPTCPGNLDTPSVTAGASQCYWVSYMSLHVRFVQGQHREGPCEAQRRLPTGTHQCNTAVPNMCPHMWLGFYLSSWPMRRLLHTVLHWFRLALTPLTLHLSQADCSAAAGDMRQYAAPQ